TKGVAMVFISHHLDEIPRVGDDVSVLRDGTLVGEVPARTSERELVTMMVGRDIDDQFPRHRGEVGAVLLSVTGLSRERAFQDVGFDLHAGEVLGLAGLVGAGRTEVLRAIAGADKYDSGTVRVRGKELPKGKISRAIVDGI
ncbi:ATP-binding cassette domain-containing protein, partial [Staphylococcus aureus]